MEESLVLSSVKIAQYSAAAIVMSVGALGACISQGKISSKTCESISANPSAEKSIRSVFFTGMIFVETSAIYCLIISLILIFAVN